MHENENLPEDHPHHVTDFGDIRDEAHMPPGNPIGGPVPTQAELEEANLIVEEKRGTAVTENDRTDEQEEDLIHKHHQGASSWISDPEAVSSDPTQAVQPGYDEEAQTGAGAEATTEPYDPTQYTIAQVEEHARAHPEEVGDLLQRERDSAAPRSSLITKLEGM